MEHIKKSIKEARGQSTEARRKAKKQRDKDLENRNKEEGPKWTEKSRRGT